MQQSSNSKLAPWQTLSDEIAFETRWFKIRKQHMRTSSGIELDYYIHDTNDSAMCVCVSEDNKVLVVRQYRPPIEKVSVDYPAGRVELDDANPEAAMLRELQEETGFVAKSTKKLSVVDKEPAFSRTRQHIFLAQGMIAGTATPEETESILPSFVTPTEVLRMIDAGEMSCTFCVSATFLAFRELGWLNFVSWK